MAWPKATTVDRMSDELSLPRKKSSKVAESPLIITKSTLGSDEEALIQGFGKVCGKDSKVRRGRNPVAGY